MALKHGTLETRAGWNGCCARLEGTQDEREPSRHPSHAAALPHSHQAAQHQQRVCYKPKTALSGRKNRRNEMCNAALKVLFGRADAVTATLAGQSRSAQARPGPAGRQVVYFRKTMEQWVHFVTIYYNF